MSFGIDPFGRLSISALINTGKMKWDLDDDNAEADCFEDYNGVERRSMDLGCLPVLAAEKMVVTCAPMKTPKDAPVIYWFAELPEKLDQFDGYDLLALAQDSMEKVESAPWLTDTFVTVPAQDLKY